MPNSIPRIRLNIYAGATSIESPYPDVVSIATDRAISIIATRYTISLCRVIFFIIPFLCAPCKKITQLQKRNCVAKSWRSPEKSTKFFYM